MTAQNDILVEIPDDHLPRLADLYHEKAPWAPYMVSFIHTTMKWKKSDKYKSSFSVLSPNNCWEEDGTIIVILQLSVQDLFVFTLDDECKNLYKGLMQTRLLNHGRLFYGVHEKHAPAVKRYLEEKNIHLSVDVPCFIYALSPDEGRKFSIECQSDVFVKKLEPLAAKQINDLWPHRFENSASYLASYIEMNGGYGIFLKSTNEMVAWVIKHAFGHLGMLQTEKNHTRKGYASLVTKALSKEIAEDGHWSVGTVLLDNKNSIILFEKLGFKCIGKCTFLILE